MIVLNLYKTNHKESNLTHSNCINTQQSNKINQYKTRVNYTINKNIADKFRVVADKDMGKMPNIVENLIK